MSPDSEIAVVGVPLDINSSFLRGAAAGPAAVRAALRCPPANLCAESGLDLDVLDPAFAPGLSHYAPGGLATREVPDILHRLPCSPLGADLVELNPDRDLHGMTAMVAAKLVKEILARMLG